MRSPHVRWLMRTLCCCTIAAAHGQSLQKSVAGGGVSAATDGWMMMHGTFGQAVVGSSGSTMHSAALGFWAPTSDLGASGIRANDQPRSGALVSVSPNPFRGAATLRYALSSTDAIRLEVFDNTGRCVSASPLMNLAPGRHEYSFSPGTLPPATYRYVVSGSHTRLTGGMTVLK